MNAGLRAAAPCKLNLALAVVGIRDDGYHELVSLFLRLGLADELTVRPADSGTPGASDDPGASGGEVLEVEGDADCPVEGNLVLRAATLLREHAGRPLPPLSIRLTKRVPVAAGLGGGSSDAATALSLVAALWRLPLAPAERTSLALRLGSDVPFFASGAAAALVGGRGEHILPLQGVRGTPGVLLIVPPERLATSDVFAAWDRLRPGNGHARTVAESVARRLANGADATALSAEAGRLAGANDLWPAALALSPALAEVRDAAEAALVRPLVLSGSGPSLAAIYPSADEAVAAARSLDGRRPAALAESIFVVTDTRTPTPIWRNS